MRRHIPKFLLLAAFCAQGAIAQAPVSPDTPERTGSPYDRNPACGEREVSGNDPACVIDDGPSRYRPRYRQNTQGTSGTQAPGAPSLPAVQTPTGTAPASGVQAPFPGGVGSTPQSPGGMGSTPQSRAK
jgi:hypothetical protein